MQPSDAEAETIAPGEVTGARLIETLFGGQVARPRRSASRTAS